MENIQKSNLSYLKGRPFPRSSLNCKSVGEYLQRNSKLYGGKTAFSFYCLFGKFKKRTLTFSDWNKLSINFAKHLPKDLKYGDYVGILLRNCPEYLIAFCGFQLLGLNTILIGTKSNLEYVANELPLKALVILESDNDIDKIKNNSKIGENCYLITINDSNNDMIGSENVQYIQYKDLIKESDIPFELPHVNPNDNLIVVLSSGSTGRSKLIQHSQSSRLKIFQTEEELKPITIFKDIYFYCVSGLQAILGCLRSASHLIITYETYMKTVDMKILVDILLEEKCVRAELYGHLINDLIKNPKLFQRLEGILKFVSTGGQMANASNLKRCCEILPNIFIYDTYSGSEYGRICTFVHAAKWNIIGNFLGSFISKFFSSLCTCDVSPGCEISIRCEAGRLKEIGEIGEIWVKSNTMMKYYINNDELTKSVYLEDGWFKTNDFGCINKQGQLELHGRMDDCIIVAGFNLYPFNVEQSLLECLSKFKNVRNVLVVGIPDKRMGNTLCAVVQCDNNLYREEIKKELLNVSRKILVKDIQDYDPYLKIENIVFIENLPMSNSWKIKRRAVSKIAIESIRNQ